MKYLNFLKTTLSLDVRSLAIYRLCLGLIIMADVLYRWGDFENFYTDIGLIPRNIFISELTAPWSFSLHLANGSLAFIYGIMSVHLLLGLLVVLGFKTRLSLMGAFLLTISVHNRNWLVQNGGDDVLRVLVFFSIFLPLNKFLALDYFLIKNKNDLPSQHFSWWSACFFFQVIAIYFFSFILKNHAAWRSDFTATYYAFRLEIFSTFIAKWLLNFPTFLKGFTAIAIYLEGYGPIILLSAFVFGKRWQMVRLIIIILFIALHLGIAMTLKVGLFPFICMVMWLALLPPVVWDKFKIPVRLEKQAAKITPFLGERMLRPQATWSSLLFEASGVLFLVILVQINLQAVRWIGKPNEQLQSLARVTHIFQNWGMFAPRPKTDNIWVEVPGFLSNGESIELLSGRKDVDQRNSEVFPDLVKNEHWRKFFLLLSDGNTNYARYYGGYLCREWNQREIKKIEDTTLRKLNIKVYSQQNLLDGSKGPIRKKLSWTHWCFPDELKRDRSK